MRDDIHKEVPRPAKIQKWIKLCLRPADRNTGRTVDALSDALRDAFRQEVTSGFRNGIVAALEGLPSLFSPLELVDHPKDLGGIGSVMECNILNCIKRRVAEGEDLRNAIWNAGIEMAASRVDSDIRCAEPILLADSKSNRHGIAQMQNDAADVDYGSIVGAALGLGQTSGSARSGSRLSPDEDLLGGARP
ncbi:hypothetical protein NKH52_25540 [Mesorhizobium sp. M1066]|uniref:hypothetical protein n=1 Tax=unclassified Mesorhizobium TaxID=325217 RepID=UPI0033370935